MSVAALAHPRMRAWPRVARDSLRLALWSADEIAEATGGVASRWTAAMCARAICSSR